MIRILRAALAALALGCAPAIAQTSFPSPGGGYVDGKVAMCVDSSSRAVPCAINVTAGATATTAAFSASLAAAPTQVTQICGFFVSSGGTTTALVVSGSITGTISGSLPFTYVFPSSGQGILGVALPQCIPASAPNTAITVSVPGGGTGTVASLSVWGNRQ